ncbi:MAG TPA: TonB-dependent receptor plug domain-containing protein, partial [Gemmatimonadaceae bacterium]|nr:TonB-dependent receptor plug domain-containing protein [Gemmatimonadaceae bacterium]
TTNADGRYSIIVPSSRVQGQTVTLTARYLRYAPASVQVVLVGGSLVQDFDLAPTEGAQVPQPRPTDTTVAVSRPTAAATVPAGATPVIRLPRALGGIVVDSSAFLEQAGPVDLPSALAGRIAGVEVQSSGALGGTSAVRVRGAHTIVGNTQPLWVVDGVALDNSSIGLLAQQRLGTGGYDYGTPVSDLNLEDIESVRLLRGPAASMLYGGRAANGVFLVTTRNGRGLSGFDISASQQFSYEEPLRLADYQNQYGQGLGGAFSFFNGMGGGVNDSVSQSWGPAFAGQPLAQSSYTEAGRAEVRPWFAQPNNVQDYFDRGRTLATNVAAQGANSTGQFRLSLANRTSDGITPETQLTRQSATFTGGVRPSSRLDLAASAQLYRDKGQDRPGSGFDESNPVSVLSVLPRQVDINQLRNHVRDAAGKQISWNYTSHNNPFFAALANDQHDDRTRLLGGLSATYAFSDMIQGTLRGGADHYTESRRFDVAPGWMGGFPFLAGRGSFATGGFETDDITATQSDVEASARITPRGEFAFTLGVGRRGNTMSLASAASDTTPAVALAPLELHADASTIYALGGIQASLASWATLDATVRHESSSLMGTTASELYPAVLASLDITRAQPEMRGTLLDALTVRAGWSRSGNDVLPATLMQMPQPAGGVTAEQLVAPEVTSGFEVGANAGLLGSRLVVDVNYYSDRTENLLFPGALGLLRGGAITNHGVEVQADAVPVRRGNVEWRVGASFGQNASNVASLPGVTTPDSRIMLPLTTPVGGVSLVARERNSLGVIMGTRFLRDANGALLLRDGHPLPDSITGPVVLGNSSPSWTGGLSSGLRIWGLDLSVLFDIRQGGQIFSASNRAGAYAGTLAETSFRPDTGLLIPGTDVATGNANTVHVSTEDYYHSLGAIGERWVYDASFVKLREARATVDLPLHSLGLHAQRMRLSIIGRNLALWTNVPNIDPEFAIGTAFIGGAELGQLP